MCVNRLSQSEIASGKFPQGNFHAYVKKNNRIPQDSSRGKIYGLMGPQSDSTDHEEVKCTNTRNHVLFTCCVHIDAKILPTTELNTTRFQALL